MESIIKIIVWPITIIVVVMLLRSALSKLVPTLKKLEYKDLKLEFEREAKTILAEAERDLPEIQEIPKPKKEDSGIRYNRQKLEPVMEILESWRDLEINIRELAKTQNIRVGRSTLSLIKALEANNLISNEVSKVILDLAALRNKVTHTNEEVITYEVSSAFSNSIKRVRSALETERA